VAELENTLKKEREEIKASQSLANQAGLGLAKKDVYLFSAESRAKADCRTIRSKSYNFSNKLKISRFNYSNSKMRGDIFL
jgi:hypothetical protein